MNKKMIFTIAFAMCVLSGTLYNKLSNPDRKFSELQISNIEALSENEVRTPCDISPGNECSYKALFPDNVKRDVTIKDMEYVFTMGTN